MPPTGFGPGSGTNGSMSDHSSAEKTHGRNSHFPTTEPTSHQTQSHMIDNFREDLLGVLL